MTDGTVFDSSYTRGDPIAFTLGKGQVIKGWDQGIAGLLSLRQSTSRAVKRLLISQREHPHAGMCVGEKRKLRIPPHLGYGDHGSPPKIPGKITGRQRQYLLV